VGAELFQGVTKQLLKCSAGATMVEFSLSVLILVGLVGAVFDLGIGLRNYSLLTTVTTDIARQVSVKSPCGNIRQGTIDRALQQMSQRYGISGGPSFVTETPPPGTIGVDFNLVGRWPLNCIFCLLSPRELSLQATGAVSIENQGLGCS